MGVICLFIYCLIKVELISSKDGVIALLLFPGIYVFIF